MIFNTEKKREALLCKLKNMPKIRKRKILRVFAFSICLPFLPADSASFIPHCCWPAPLAPSLAALRPPPGPSPSWSPRGSTSPLTPRTPTLPCSGGEKTSKLSCQHFLVPSLFCRQHQKSNNSLMMATASSSDRGSKKDAKATPKASKALTTSAKRIQKELAEITLDPPPNCR